MGFRDADYLQEALGRGDLGPTAVMKALYPDHDPEEVAGDGCRRPWRSSSAVLTRSDRGVRIQGMDNLMVRYSQCCQPVPGDQVVGYITRGRGVSIHGWTAPMCSISPRIPNGGWRSSGARKRESASS